MRYKSYLAASAAVLALGGAAQAAGGYVSLHGGALVLEDTRAEFLIGPPSAFGVVKSDTGYRVGGALGYEGAQGLGLELEFSYAKAKVDTITVVAPVALPPLAGNGDGSLFTIGGNFLFGQTMNGWRLYGGAGVGAVRQSIAVVPDAPLDAGVNGEDWTWMGQIFTGFEVNLGRSVALGGRYRYQHVGETNYRDGDGDPVTVASHGSHSFEVTLRFMLGQR